MGIMEIFRQWEKLKKKKNQQHTPYTLTLSHEVGPICS
jgi:hypothetical protein